jgi:hypothetical protein
MFMNRRITMNKLRVWILVLVMLSVSAPSFGYVLVYKTYGRLKAVNSEANSLAGVPIRGYLIMDLNETNGEVNDVYWVTYGKDTEGTKVYTLSVPDLQLQVCGRYQSVYMNIDEGWFVTIIGRQTYKNVGLAESKPLAFTMSGSFIVYDSIAFDMTQLLRGSGTMVTTLSSTMTQASNQATKTVDDVLNDVITLLEAAGYSGS